MVRVQGASRRRLRNMRKTDSVSQTRTRLPKKCISKKAGGSHCPKNDERPCVSTRDALSSRPHTTQRTSTPNWIQEGRLSPRKSMTSAPSRQGPSTPRHSHGGPSGSCGEGESMITLLQKRIQTKVRHRSFQYHLQAHLRPCRQQEDHVLSRVHVEGVG